MKYIILHHAESPTFYSAVDLSNDTIGRSWRDSIPEAITELRRFGYNPKHFKLFNLLKATPIEDYPTFESGGIFKFHSIIDSDINPELFI